MKKAVILLIGIIILASCSDDEELIGQWEDNIHLSTNSVEFSSKTDSVTITTQGDWWWVNGITFDDSIYNYYSQEGIDLESDNYLIEAEDFIVEKRDKNTLFVKISENTSSSPRIMSITLEAGDYFDYVTITQSGN